MKTQNQTTIGVIGLGIMGAAMARNLLKAGFKVCVYNRTKAKTEALASAGAEAAASPRELAERCEVIITMVTNPEAVWEVCRGSQGVLSANGKGKVLIQQSTLDVDSVTALAAEAQKAGYEFLDCPVTGSKKQVEAGELIFEAGGESALIEKMKPVLMAMGKHIVMAGPIGAGTGLKLCMNLIVSQITTGLCEGVALARALDVDPAGIFEVLSASPALNCPYFAIKKDALLKQSYAPAFSVANMLKDTRFMNKEANKRALTLPVTQAVLALLEAALARGLGDQDLTAISETLKPQAEK